MRSTIAMTHRRTRAGRPTSVGQVLVLFVLFLLVLLGVSALGIDYISWLLTDRTLQNYSDHAALAGASEFDLRQTGANCASLPATCTQAREQAWKSLANDLDLRDGANAPLGDAAIVALGANDSPAGGQADGTYGGQSITFLDRIWVSTPPPGSQEYRSAGGRYENTYGIVFVRVDRQVRAFFGGAIGITPGPRTGWATAGALPTDFALEIFCRNNVAPESGVCVNSAGLTIDGQGGIRLLRGDIGSNESLVVTANTGSGVIVEAGNVFVVNGTCAPSSWNCPQTPAFTGGIADDDPNAIPNVAIGKNAFYIAPIPVPQFESPINGTTDHSYNCASADPTHLCVPYKDQASSSPSSPGDWTCGATSASPVWCGTPTVTTVSGSSSVSCVGQGGGNPGNHYYPNGVSAGASQISGDAGHMQSNGNEWQNIDDNATTPDPDTTSTPANPPTDWVYTDDINTTGSASDSFTVNLAASGPRNAGISTVRYTVFKTDDGAVPPLDNGNAVTVTVRLLPGSGSTAIATDVVRTLTNVPTQYFFDVGAGVIPAAQFNSLRLQFTFDTTGVSTDTERRGGGVSAAEIEHPDPQPSIPPLIPPGYYRSIIIPDSSCAVLDPTGEYAGILAYQRPGIYQFGGSGSASDKKIKIGDGSFLIGDGVTLVFDADWPDSGSNQGVAIGANGALVLNTMRVPGVPPCTPSETETLSVNQSSPSLGDLQYSGLCAAWGVDTTITSGIRTGASAWPVCTTSGATCLNRLTDYNPVAGYRGITFFFTPDGWPPSGITNRFEMQGGSGNEAGLAFRGVLYAPYDDVKITGGNGFNTVGQVLAWTAKFNGGSAFINLDYPYDFTPASPYLLEPTVSH
jgi:hypothetical protein